MGALQRFGSLIIFCCFLWETIQQQDAKKIRKHKAKVVHGGHPIKYGVDLPSFAFDYSELVVSATIERARNSDSLYLTMLFVGHRAIYHDFPFESISTDEEVLHKWSQAVKNWNSRWSNPNHSLLHQRHNVSSGLDCVIHNNEQKHTQPYYSSGHWVSTDNLPSHIRGNLEMLRCKIKGSHSAYSTLAHTDGHISVDIVRKRPMISKKDSSANLPLDQFQGSHGDSTVISFHVPWKSRVTGFGLSFHSESTMLDPWAGAQRSLALGRRSNQSEIGTMVGVESQHLKQIRVDSIGANDHYDGAVQSTNPRQKSTAIMCASNFQALAQENVIGIRLGMPSLLEFLTHHYLLGVDHIILGLQLDWKSVHMERHLKTLRKYIDEKKLSLVALNLPGFDELSGFSGTQLHDEYAELFFMNQCLAYVKGLADIALFQRVNEFLIGATASSEITLFELVLDNRTTNSLPSLSSRRLEQIDSAGAKGTSHLRYGGTHRGTTGGLALRTATQLGSVHGNVINARIVYSSRSPLDALPGDVIAQPPIGDRYWISEYFNNTTLYYLALTPSLGDTMGSVSAIVNLHDSSVPCLVTRTTATSCFANPFPQGMFFRQSSEFSPNIVLMSYVNPLIKNTSSSLVRNVRYEALTTSSIFYSARKVRWDAVRMALVASGYDTVGKANQKSAEVLWNSEPQNHLPSGVNSLKKPFWVPCAQDHLGDVLKGSFH